MECVRQHMGCVCLSARKMPPHQLSIIVIVIVILNFLMIVLMMTDSVKLWLHWQHMLHTLYVHPALVILLRLRPGSLISWHQSTNVISGPANEWRAIAVSQFVMFRLMLLLHRLSDESVWKRLELFDQIL